VHYTVHCTVYFVYSRPAGNIFIQVTIHNIIVISGQLGTCWRYTSISRDDFPLVRDRRPDHDDEFWVKAVSAAGMCHRGGSKFSRGKMTKPIMETSAPFTAKKENYHDNYYISVQCRSTHEHDQNYVDVSTMSARGSIIFN